MKNRVRELRTRFGMTQEDLAERIEVSRQTIISIETGKYNPSILLGYKISYIFGEKIEDVFLCEEEIKGEKEK